MTFNTALDPLGELDAYAADNAGDITLNDILGGRYNPSQFAFTPYGQQFATPPSPFTFSQLPSFVSSLTASPATPLYPNLPVASRKFQKKYEEIAPILQRANLPPSIVNSLLRFDTERVQRGSDPITVDETTKALRSAQTGQAATPPPDRDLWDLPVNIFKDVRDIASSVPRLPLALLNEVRALPQLPGAVSAAMASGNLGDIISGLTDAPGLRLLPGAYTLGNVARGDFDEIVTHPVMTALDVLPAAKELNGALNLTEKLSQTRVGKMGTALNADLKASRLGQFAQQMWGQQNRELSILANHFTWKVAQQMDPVVATNDALAQVAKRSVTIANDFTKAIPDPLRRREVFDLMERGDFSTFNPDELHAATRVRDSVNELAAYNVADETLAKQDWLGSAELFDTATAAQMAARNLTLTRYQGMNKVYTALDAAFASIGKPGVLGRLVSTPADLQTLTFDLKPLMDSAVPTATKKRLLQGVGYLHDAGGFDLPANYRVMVNRGNVEGAYNALTQHVPTELPNAKWNDRAVKRWLNDNRKYSDAKAANLERRVATMNRRATPARFMPVAEDTMKAAATRDLTAKGLLISTNPDFELIEGFLRDGKYKSMVEEKLITSDDLRTWQREARESAALAKEAGVDPVFLHRVSESSVGSIEHPKPLAMLRDDARRIASVSQVKARTFDTQSYVHDVGIALNHQAMELVNRRAATEFAREIFRTDPLPGETVSPFARTYAQLRRQYAGVGRTTKQLNPALDDAAAIDKRIAKEWTPVKIEQLPAEVREALGWTAGDLGNAHPYLPKSVYRNLKLFLDPKEFGPLIDAPTTVFRTALLPLSPRWHIYNVLGGAVQLVAQTGLDVFKYMGDARALVNAAKVGDAAGVPERFLQTFGAQRTMEMEWRHASGSRLGQWWQEIQAAKPAVAHTVDGFNKVVKKSFDLNAFFDDTYRTMAYMYGKDKALVKGLTPEEAAARGEALARRTMTTWDDLTPLERTTLRYVFPFYGWAQHILRYSYRYPIDHPFRAAITASFARNELADLGTGLPQTLLNSLFLGSPDKDGNVTALNMGGMNPFRDVANYMTLAGFLSTANPLIATTLQQLGVDVASGGTNLYPNVSYDAQTGRLKATHPNFALNLVNNILPQSQILTGMLDRSSELQDLFRRDPAAGGRLAMSQAGLPILWRQYNLPQEQFKAELNRQEAQSVALSDAIRSGDWEDAAAWPALRPVLGQIQSLLRSHQFDQFASPPADFVTMQQQLAASFA